MSEAVTYVVAQAVTYVVFGVLGTVLWVLHRKGEGNAANISKVDREVAGLGGRFIGRDEHESCRQEQREALEAKRRENREDHQRMFGTLDGLKETTTKLEEEVRRMNGGEHDPVG